MARREVKFLDPSQTLESESIRAHRRPPPSRDADEPCGAWTGVGEKLRPQAGGGIVR